MTWTPLPRTLQVALNRLVDGHLRAEREGEVEPTDTVIFEESSRVGRFEATGAVDVSVRKAAEGVRTLTRAFAEDAGHDAGRAPAA
jgi:hypothetical protein